MCPSRQILYDALDVDLAHRVYNRRNLRINAHTAAQQSQICQRMLLNVSKIRLQALTQSFYWLKRGIWRSLSEQLLRCILYNCNIKIMLRREVVIEQSLRDISHGGNIINSDLFIG